ncbi:hypothetical protein E2562_018196 [Oryza meyeriana var. granulata]|uniref:Uncharacterized protein n=1 Tax=Oryza meyeriana var. granulata TaxID=110450 RepID=A0A6G1C7R5_9ORYZ|nr:hypothetical protein E2562_018196 [Oryza meyeriana var. granulata]
MALRASRRSPGSAGAITGFRATQPPPLPPDRSPPRLTGALRRALGGRGCATGTGSSQTAATAARLA